MNIFYLDEDPIKAANYLCDKHIIKMCLETAQMLCTVSWRYNVEAKYKIAHKNHPSTLWAGASLENWEWLVMHGLAIGEEYTRRYDKIHKSSLVISWCLESGGRPAPKGFTAPPQCMPDAFKAESAVDAYRAYYLGDKASFAKWDRSPTPEWWLQ